MINLKSESELAKKWEKQLIGIWGTQITGYTYIGGFGDNTSYFEPKKLAGDTTHVVRPIQWWFDPNVQSSPTVHGPIKNGYTFCLAVRKDQFPAIELGGSPEPTPASPVFHPNVNIVPGSATDIMHDMNNPFPIDSNAYGFVFSQFTIEHIKNSRIKQFISECYRITKPGGVNIHIGPNLKAQCAAMVSLEKWTSDGINTIFGGGGDFQSQDPWEGYHHTGFSPEMVVEMFKEAGFSEVVVWEFPRFHLEMIIEAWKS